jgi:hypothetical protein
MPKGNSAIDVFKYYDITPGPNGCWQWHGSWGGQEREKRPYFMAGRRRQIAYRWVYELYHGIILTPDQYVLHNCDCGGYPIGCGSVHHMRLGTRTENTNDAIERDRLGLPKTVVRAIRKLLAEGRTQQDIADVYGVARTTISAIATGRSHASVEDAE